MSYWIVSDICSDLPEHYVKGHEKFYVLPMPYRMEGEERQYGVGDEKNISLFYQKLKNGIMAKTAQINIDTYYRAFRDITEQGEGVLYLSLSSGISGSIQSAMMARKMLLDERPEARVEVVDSLCASLGHGLFTHYVLQQRAQGKSLDEAARWAVNNRQKINHWFTVDDLNFLFKGGRVSRSSAFMGSMLRIKPVMNVNYEGHLTPIEKVQGRKRSLKRLAEETIRRAKPKEQTIFISHGDCLEDAEYLADLIREGMPEVKEIMISPIGCVIGAHSGPGTVAIFSMGEGRA